MCKNYNLNPYLSLSIIKIYRDEELKCLTPEINPFIYNLTINIDTASIPLQSSSYFTTLLVTHKLLQL